MRIGLRFMPALLALFFLMGIQSIYAQPVNDDCANPLPVEVGADKESAVSVEGDTRGATPSTTPEDVCSGSFFGDDIWFTFTIDGEVPASGLEVFAEFGVNPDDMPVIGMAVYESCATDAIPIDCFSSQLEEVDQNALFLPPNCLVDGEDYYVRVWSGGGVDDFSGTVRISAYPADPRAPNNDVIFYEEDFNDGFGDWTTEGVSDTSHVWIWTEDGNFPDAFGGTQKIINFDGGCTGAMAFPAGWYQTGETGDVNNVPPGPPYPEIHGMLISPNIDLTEAGDAVALTFDQYFRGLNGSGFTDLGMEIHWSEDGGTTWSLEGNQGFFFNVNEEFENQTFYNDNQRRFTFTGLGGNDQVRFRFVFRGDFYFWAIDNFRVVKVEDNNLAIDENSSVIAPSLQTPQNAVEPIHFGTTISNFGGVDQPNTTITVSIENSEGDVVYTDAKNIGTLPSLQDTVVTFENTWIPESSQPDGYTITYSVASDSTDFDDSDNSESYRYNVTENLMAKVISTTGGWTPGAGFYDEGAPHAWVWGNAYYLPNDMTLDRVQIGLSNGDSLTYSLAVILYSWEDQNSDFVVQSNERTILGVNTYDMTGEEGTSIIDVPLTDFNSGADTINLPGDATYLIMVEYEPDNDDEILFLQGDTDIDFEPMVNVYAAEGKPRYAGVIGIPTDGSVQNIEYVAYDPTGTQRDLGVDIAPVVNLVFRMPTTSVRELSEANRIALFPNPASESLTVDLDFTEILDDVIVNILDAQGKQVFTNRFQGIQNQRLFLDLDGYPNGAYMLQVVTEQGQRTERFAVQK